MNWSWIDLALAAIFTVSGVVWGAVVFLMAEAERTARRDPRAEDAP